MAEYTSMLLVSLLAAILFLGAWHFPVPLGLTANGWLGAVVGVNLASYLGNLLGLLCLMTKGVLSVVVMMWIRWSMPRLRIDQVMTTCLKYCTPLAAVCFLGATAWQAAFPGGLLWRPPAPYLEMTNDQVPMTNTSGAAAPHWSLGLGHWDLPPEAHQ